MKLDMHKNTILLSGLLLSGCGTGPTIFDILEERYWRPEDQIDGQWETNWQVWYQTEEECLAAIDETQRCRQTRL